MLATGSYDALIVTGNLGGYGLVQPDQDLAAGERAAAGRLAELVSTTGRGVLVQTMFPDGEACRLLAARGVPVVRDAAVATGAVAALAARFDALSAPSEDEAPTVERPEWGDRGYLAARAGLAALGLDVPPALGAASVEAAVRAAHTLGYPVVVKATSPLHKSDAGGVRLDLVDDDAVAAAYSELAMHLGPQVVVERQVAERGVELLIGASRDPRFGVVALAALGGVAAEMLGDVAVALGPIGPSAARKLIQSLRAAPLLSGRRGALDVDGAARALAVLTAALAVSPELGEIEINPLLVTVSGALVLDARLTPRTEEDVWT